jgi:integrase/recombinase XerD
LRSVQEMLGHASIKTTEVYTHLDTGHVRSLHRLYHPRA